MNFRQASIEDKDRIAQLHAQSWQTTYRGMLNDDYLDHSVLPEMLGHWQQRLAHHNADQWVLLAEENTYLRGFSCVFFNTDPDFGAYLDNLHVGETGQGRGIGQQLMQKSLHSVYQHDPRSGLYLWVFVNNDRAIDFYLKQGGAVIEQQLQQAPGGGSIEALRIVWKDLGQFVDQ